MKGIRCVLDIRQSSKTFKKFITVEFSAKNGLILFVPKGCAYGFKSLEDNTIMEYNVSIVYSLNHDCGIRYDSFEMDWNVENTIISKRDAEFKSIDEVKLFK